MHVVHVVHRYPPALGGSESYVERLSAYLAGRGHAVTVLTSTAIDLLAMREHGHAETPAGVTPGNPPGAPTVVRFAPLRFPLRRPVVKALSLVGPPAWRGFWSPASPILPGLLRYEPHIKTDAVHAFAFPYAMPLGAALRLARRHQARFLLTPFLHVNDARTARQYTRAPLRRLLHAADVVFVQTAPEADAVRTLGVPAGRVQLQGLGVEPAECTGGDRAGLRLRLGIAPHEVVVGHLANLSAEKGTNDLIRAVPQLAPHVRQVLAGPAMPNLLPLPPGVIALGPLSDDQKRDFFAAIDLFALPSRSDSFGLVLLEAWANAAPVVVAASGGPGALVRHERDGLTVPLGDVNALSAAVNRLALDAGLRRRLGEAGRARCAAEFRWADKLAMVERRLGE